MTMPQPQQPDTAPATAAPDANDGSGNGARVIVEGAAYLRDAQGRLTPEALVRPQDLLHDGMVRRTVAFAVDLSAQITRFRAHCFDDIAAFDALLEDEYGGHTRRSVKGNRTYLSYDGTMKAQVQIAERVAFGPEMQVARDLVDECLAEWSRDSGNEMRAIVGHAFQVDREGHLQPAAARYRLCALAAGDGGHPRRHAGDGIENLYPMLPARDAGRGLDTDHHRSGKGGLSDGDDPDRCGAPARPRASDARGPCRVPQTGSGR